MFKMFTLVFIISLMLNFAKAAERDDNVPAIDEDLPLILIKGHTRLFLPTYVEIKNKRKWFRKEKIIQFRTFIYEKQAFYCPPENEEQNKKIDKFNEISDSITKDCLFKKKKTKKMETRFPKCQKPPQPVMMQEVREKQTTETKENNKNTSNAVEPVPCGPSNAGKNLIYGYEICDEYEGFLKLEYKFRNKNEVYPFNVETINVYEICYNANKQEILFTSHIILAPSLLKDYLLEKEIKKYPPGEMRTNTLKHIKIDFERVKDKFKEIENSNTTPKVKIQHLVPLEDFPFMTWKTPAFHYVNASFINEELQSCWNGIHDVIRNNAIQETRKYTILTRVFKSSEMPFPNYAHIEIEITDIPIMWMKLVYYITREEGKKAVAIIANNYRDKSINNMISKQFECEQNLCWRIIKQDFSGVRKDIRCCKVTAEIQKLFGLDTNIKFKVLDIEDLIETGRDPSYGRSVTSPTHS